MGGWSPQACGIRNCADPEKVIPDIAMLVREQGVDGACKELAAVGR